MALTTRAPTSEDTDSMLHPFGAGADASLEETLHEILDAEEVEQAHLARMLHDNAGQNLAALLLGFKGLERDLDNQPDARLTLQSLHAITQSIGQELHRIALELRPTSLDDHGLARALGAFLDEWAVMEKAQVEFDSVSLGEPRLPRRIEAALFRVIRHALHAIAKAEHGAHLSVILQRSAECVTAVIENTGEPLPRNDRGGLSPRLHLAAMEARLRLAGGSLLVEPRPPHGVSFFLRLPLPPAADS